MAEDSTNLTSSLVAFGLTLLLFLRGVVVRFVAIVPVCVVVAFVIVRLIVFGTSRGDVSGYWDGGSGRLRDINEFGFFVYEFLMDLND